jgi:hypothetical protein
MTLRTLGLLTLGFCAGAASHIALARAQSRAASADALLAVPDMYRVELENEFVRVVRVRYPARSSGAIHTHPAPGALIVPDVGLERLVVRHTLRARAKTTAHRYQDLNHNQSRRQHGRRSARTKMPSE